jgi:hypothetical protein
VGFCGVFPGLDSVSVGLLGIFPGVFPGLLIIITAIGVLFFYFVMLLNILNLSLKFGD